MTVIEQCSNRTSALDMHLNN